MRDKMYNSENGCKSIYETYYAEKLAEGKGVGVKNTFTRVRLSQKGIIIGLWASRPFGWEDWQVFRKMDECSFDVVYNKTTDKIIVTERGKGSVTDIIRRKWNLRFPNGQGECVSLLEMRQGIEVTQDADNGHPAENECTSRRVEETVFSMGGVKYLWYWGGGRSKYGEVRYSKNYKGWEYFPKFGVCKLDCVNGATLGRVSTNSN
jgi:hypothetical protein